MKAHEGGEMLRGRRADGTGPVERGRAGGLLLLAGFVLAGAAACAGGAPEAETPAPAPAPEAAEAAAPAAVEREPAPGLRSNGDPMEPRVLRPIPAPVVPPPWFAEALVRDTRSADGSPGADYWTNRSVYDIDASLDPATGVLTGRETITYHNRSPHTLQLLVLHLHQNLHAPGVVRNEAQEVTGGVEIRSVAVAGAEAAEGPGGGAPFYQVQGTLMAVGLPSPLAPGGEVELEIEWSVTLPQSGAGRMGWSDREMYYVAYWFPRMAVFDDLRGWDAEPYLGGAEFYDGFGDYDVRLTVPEGWTVMATGELTNAADVYRPAVLERLEAAGTADTIVPVVTVSDRLSDVATVDGPGDRLTYRFTAENVRDFAWTTSNVQRWDATSALVPDRDGDGRDDRVLIHAFWREDRAPLWSRQALYGKQSVEHHTRFTGHAYPWPHMTSVEGDQIIGGGMEFPMMTIIGPYRGREPQDLFNVTSHEIAHMWIPMIVGTNEKRFAWIDEGSTTFLENMSRLEYYPGGDPQEGERQSWFQVARAGLEQPLMRHGDYYEPGPGYGTASYPKPAALLGALREVVGEDAFMRAYRTFIDEWAYGHPTPWDLFNTFERFAGRDLDWWWTPFYFETWTLDHAVVGVEQRPGGRTVVVVEDRGWAVAPAEVVVRTGNRDLRFTVPETDWLEGRRRVEVELPPGAGRVTRVEVDPAPSVPDIDRSDNVWEAAEGDGASGPGRLVVVGGSLDDDNDAVWRAVTGAREGEGPLCVLPTASGVPERSMASAVERLAREVGEDRVEGVFVTEADPAAADTPEVARRLRSCSGFWFTGGDQSRIVDVFLPRGRPTAGYEALRERHAEGAVVAGSSAGAAMMTARMIAGGGSEAALVHGVRDAEDGEGVWVRRGMGFLDGPLVDQHFLRRGRVGRLLAATMAGEGGGVGLGIDENTALVIDGTEATVVGESGVLLVDARQPMRTPGAVGVEPGPRVVLLRLLGPGDRVDLGTLEVREAAGRAPVVVGDGSVALPDDPFGSYAFLHLLADLAASPDSVAEVTVAGHRLRLSEGPGFRAMAEAPGGVDGTPRGFSAGPWLLEVVPPDGSSGRTR